MITGTSDVTDGAKTTGKVFTGLVTVEELSKVDTGVSKEASIYKCAGYALHNPVGTIDIVGMRTLYFFQ